MKMVYKVETSLTGIPTEVRIPLESKIVHVAQQYPTADESSVAIWFEVERGESLDETRTVCAYGTGHSIPTDAIYLSTHLLMRGSLVLHLYELVA